MKKTKHENQKGFTVLESIVAIAILSLSISGVFSAIQQSFSQNIIAKDEVKAFYLAQEAIEIIRNKRDENQLAKISNPSKNWLAGIAENNSDPCWFGKTCRADATGPGNPSVFLYRCGDAWDTCPILNQDQTTFLYNYNSVSETNLATNFKREIQIERVNGDEIALTVRVSWTKGSLPPFVFKVKTHLFNWI